MTVTKCVEISGTSTETIEAAIDTALSRAAITISNIESFEVEKIGGTTSPSGVWEYRVHLKVTFAVADKIHE